MDKCRAENIPKSQCHHLPGFQLGGLEGEILTVVLQILSSQCHNLAVFLYSGGWLLTFAVVIMLMSVKNRLNIFFHFLSIGVK